MPNLSDAVLGPMRRRRRTSAAPEREAVPPMKAAAVVEREPPVAPANAEPAAAPAEADAEAAELKATISERLDEMSPAQLEALLDLIDSGEFDDIEDEAAGGDAEGGSLSYRS